MPFFIITMKISDFISEVCKREGERAITSTDVVRVLRELWQF